jgi:hypothetical protein
MKFKGYEYKQLLRMFDGYKPFPATPDYNGKAVYLRHDIDGNPEKSLLMARIEAEMGIKSTYFALNYSDYWDIPGTFDILREIQSLGHEVGWHQCVIVQAHILHSIDVRELIERPLLRMRREGLEVRGTSPHGSSYGAQHDIDSWRLWSCFNKPFPPFDAYELSDFSLEYEAMRVYRDGYLSDSSNKWNGDPFFFEKLVKESDKFVLQINIHPQWWE